MISFLVASPFFFLYPLLRSYKKENIIHRSYLISFLLSSIGSGFIIYSENSGAHYLYKEIIAVIFIFLCIFIGIKYREIFGGSSWWFNQPLNLYEWTSALFCLLGIITVYVIFGLAYL
jgi:hypothetical protein